MDVVPELRQEPALLRVLRNSPRAMPLFGLPIIVMFALYTSRKQGKVTARLCLRRSRDLRVQIAGFCPVTEILCAKTLFFRVLNNLAPDTTPPAR